MKSKIKNQSDAGRIKRHLRIRKKIFGTNEAPRLSVHRSNKNIQVQFIDDAANTTLLSFSTNDKEFKKECGWGGNISAAKKFGLFISQEAKKKKIERIVFDRGGYLYHGRIKALADGAREGGLKF
ncbi:MAG: 50S ribosomal protein L18 [Candidatus Omnitrophota bacterium]